MILPSSTRAYLVLGSTDLRKAINGLSLLVTDIPEMDVFSGQLFVFCNKSRTLIKILYWDRNGFCLWQKRLEKHRFFWHSARARSRSMVSLSSFLSVFIKFETVSPRTYIDR